MKDKYFLYFVHVVAEPHISSLNLILTVSHMLHFSRYPDLFIKSFIKGQRAGSLESLLQWWWLSRPFDKQRDSVSSWGPMQEKERAQFLNLSLTFTHRTVMCPLSTQLHTINKIKINHVSNGFPLFQPGFGMHPNSRFSVALYGSTQRTPLQGTVLQGSSVLSRYFY